MTLSISNEAFEKDTEERDNSENKKSWWTNGQSELLSRYSWSLKANRKKYCFKKKLPYFHEYFIDTFMYFLAKPSNKLTKYL